MIKIGKALRNEIVKEAAATITPNRVLSLISGMRTRAGRKPLSQNIRDMWKDNIIRNDASITADDVLGFKNKILMIKETMPKGNPKQALKNIKNSPDLKYMVRISQSKMRKELLS